MLVTFLIEFLGAGYTLVRYKMNAVGRIIVVLLVCLGLFQVAEFMICEKIGGVEWSRIGFFATTLLPPLGISLGLAVAKTRGRAITVFKALMWTACVLLSFYVVFWKEAIRTEICSGNYVIFYTSEIMWAYSVYYFALFSAGLSGGLVLARRAVNKRVRKSLYAIIFGALGFLAPTVVVNLLKSETVEAIPSVMCGFAVVFALVLIFVVLPTSGMKRVYKNDRQ
jgi:hypothetical protein